MRQTQQTTDNDYISLLDRLNRIPVIIPALVKKTCTAKESKIWLYEDLLKENGEATW